jgi:hypothetical protein
VAVDEARRDHPSLGVDDLACGFADAADGGNAAVSHADVGAITRQPEPSTTQPFLITRS